MPWRKALELIQVLATPGLTCSDLSRMLEEELGLHVPSPELQRYFAMWGQVGATRAFGQDGYQQRRGAAV